MLERIRICLPAGAEVDVRMIYGVDALVAHGIPFAATHGGDLIVRLDVDSRDEALTLPGSTEWNPMGRGEADFVIIPGAYLASDDQLRYWVERAYEYAESLSAIDSEEVGYEDDFDHYGHDDMRALSEMPPPPRPKPTPKAKPAPKPKAEPRPAPAPIIPEAPALARAVKAKATAVKKAVKKGVKKVAAKRAVTKKAVKTAVKKAAKGMAARKTAVKKAVKKAAKRMAARKTAVKKAVAKRTAAKKK